MLINFLLYTIGMPEAKESPFIMFLRGSVYSNMELSVLIMEQSACFVGMATMETSPEGGVNNALQVKLVQLNVRLETTRLSLKTPTTDFWLTVS